MRRGFLLGTRTEAATDHTTSAVSQSVRVGGVPTSAVALRPGTGPFSSLGSQVMAMNTAEIVSFADELSIAALQRDQDREEARLQHRKNHVRRILQPMLDMAARFEYAILEVRRRGLTLPIQIPECVVQFACFKEDNEDFLKWPREQRNATYVDRAETFQNNCLRLLTTARGPDNDSDILQNWAAYFIGIGVWREDVQW